jgi:transposase-like protein
MRKTYSGQFKLNAVLEILKENKTISQLASELEVHPNQILNWKKQALEELAKSLEDGRRKAGKEKQSQDQIQELYAEIGELTTKLNWLKKKSGIRLD